MTRSFATPLTFRKQHAGPPAGVSKCKPALALVSGEDGWTLSVKSCRKCTTTSPPTASWFWSWAMKTATFTQLYPQLPWISFDTQLGSDQVLGSSGVDLKTYFELSPPPKAQHVQNSEY
jgi:hypothetical protein